MSDTEEEAALVGYIVQKDDKMWDIAKDTVPLLKT